MTRIRLKSGLIVYSDMKPEEVRHYLFGGSKTGCIKGWLDSGKTEPIEVAVHAIEVIFDIQV